MQKAFDLIVERLEEKAKHDEQRAIKTNETEMVSAITALQAMADRYRNAIEIVNQVAEQFGNSEQVNDGWISCEERLPEKDDKYLVCTKSPTNYYNVTTSYFTNDLYDFDKYAFGRHKGKKKASFCDYDSECGYYEVSNVIAWQPLPTAYVKGD